MSGSTLPGTRRDGTGIRLQSDLFGQMREIHDEDTHIAARKPGEAYMPVEPGSPLVAAPDVQVQSR